MHETAKGNIITVVRERAKVGLISWTAAAAVAKNREKWRQLISGPIPHQEERNWAKIENNLGVTESDSFWRKSQT